MTKSWCIALIVACLFGRSIVLTAQTNVDGQINEVLHSAYMADAVDWDGTEQRLLELLDEDSTPSDQGKVYRSLAIFYNGDSPNHYEKRAHYARKALGEELGVIEACDMYILLTGTATGKYWRKKKEDITAEQIAEQAMPAVEGLAFTLKHFRIDIPREPPISGFYSPGLRGPEYRDAVRRLQEQQATIKAIRDNRRLLFFRTPKKGSLLSVCKA